MNDLPTNKITAASTLPNAASEAGPETVSHYPPTAPVPPTVYPRDQQATMQSDWHNLLCVLRMCQDRALTGTPLHLLHPTWLSPQADYLWTMRNSVVRMIDDVFSTAVVEREDATQSAP